MKSSIVSTSTYIETSLEKEAAGTMTFAKPITPNSQGLNLLPFRSLVASKEKTGVGNTRHDSLTRMQNTKIEHPNYIHPLHITADIRVQDILPQAATLPSFDSPLRHHGAAHDHEHLPFRPARRIGTAFDIEHGPEVGNSDRRGVLELAESGGAGGELDDRADGGVSKGQAEDGGAVD
ncbi:hypothetical protein NL676_028236 [Syzygium grande]|nr:hypothetical protein NL676_028236 [Syzygium grande]